VEVIAADLLNPRLNYFEKEKHWERIRTAGAADRVLASFERKSQQHPKDPELHFLVGKACINKLSSATDAEKSVLGRKADEAFTRALSLNPEHWEARFTKALCLTYWPAFLGKQPECVRELETLLSQQEKSPQEEKFVQAYVVLGNLYLQYGDRAKALHTWKRGLVQFPGNPELSGKISELKE
jgi:tetratricopeptide (TPR) repeat protein